MNLFSRASSLSPASRSKFAAILLVLMAISIPLVIWAVRTQQFELRKRAASGEPSQCSPIPLPCQSESDPVTCAQQYGLPPGGWCIPQPTITYAPSPTLQPCTPLSQDLVDCIAQGKTLDDCTATMGAPLLPWCKPTPTPIVEPECRMKPEGASCCASNCPPGATCIQSCAEGTCNNGQCLPNKPELVCQGKPDGTYCSPLGYCQSQKCVPVPPRCYFQQVQCFKAPCDPILLCPTPTPTQNNCNNQPNGSQCWISGFCPPPPPCTPPGPCVSYACPVNPGICQNGICVSTPTPTSKPANSCNGAPDGSSCTRTVCRPRKFFGGFSNFFPEQCEQLPGVCQYNTCIEPPKPPLASCKQGDINRDGMVDTQDLGYLLVNFLQHVPQLSIPTVDINGDGVVDVSDYSLFAKDFGSSTGPCI